MTLTPRGKLTALKAEELIVNGALLTDTLGREIDGNGDGQPGGDYIVTISGTRLTTGGLPLARTPRQTPSIADVVDHLLARCRLTELATSPRYRNEARLAARVADIVNVRWLTRVTTAHVSICPAASVSMEAGLERYGNPWVEWKSVQTVPGCRFDAVKWTRMPRASGWASLISAVQARGNGRVGGRRLGLGPGPSATYCYQQHPLARSIREVES